MRVLLSVRANICTTRTKYALSKKIICAYAYTVCAYSYYAYRFIARTLIHISLTRIHISLTPIHISLINNALTPIHISPINIARTRIHILPIDRHWEQKLCAFALALHSGKSRANHSIRCLRVSVIFFLAFPSVRWEIWSPVDLRGNLQGKVPLVIWDCARLTSISVSIPVYRTIFSSTDFCQSCFFRCEIPGELANTQVWGLGEQSLCCLSKCANSITSCFYVCVTVWLMLHRRC